MKVFINWLGERPAEPEELAAPVWCRQAHPRVGG